MGFLTVAAFVVGTALQLESRQEQRRANREAQRFNEEAQRQAAVENDRARRRAASEAGSQVARIQAASATLGAASGASASGFQTAAIGVQSQAASNIGFQNQLALLDQSRFRTQQRLLAARGRSQDLAALGGLAFDFGSAFGKTTRPPQVNLT
jgi:hypothetical protein